jgi:hypothetical protein
VSGRVRSKLPPTKGLEVPGRVFVEMRLWFPESLLGGADPGGYFAEAEGAIVWDFGVCEILTRGNAGDGRPVGAMSCAAAVIGGIEQ